MTLIWTDPIPDDPTDDGDGTWIWCPECAGTGEVVHYSTGEEIRCFDCKGWGGRYESLLETAEKRQDEAEYREEK